MICVQGLRANTRHDIQGLRALAVVAVIVNHSVGWPSGGFLGVDIFFVISGFIITSLLLREVDRTGRISFVSFYRRRVKRILPAATLVLLVTVVMSYATFGGDRARQVLADALAAAFFVSNWRVAAEGTDYWADDGTTSPLQHFWSLGVEEQFYLLWPVVIALVGFRLARSRGFKPTLAGVLTGLAGASLLWAANQAQSEPMWAYFSTITRGWELAAGALVAVSATQLGRIPQAVRPYLAWGGLVLLVGALGVTSEADAMPVPGALLAVAATVVIIAAGVNADSAREVWPLSNRASGYIGNISYSLYLWHLPVVIFLGAYFEFHERRFLVAVLAVTFALSVATYHLLEDPVRRSSWLEPGGGKRSRAVSWAAGSAVASMVIAGAVVVSVPASPAGAHAGASGASTPTTQSELTEQLRSALDATEWPSLSPAPGDVADASRPDEDRQGCGMVDFTAPDSCWFPNPGAHSTAVVMGDSTAITLFPTIREALGPDWNVRGATMAGCPQLPTKMDFSTPDRLTRCTEHRTAAMSAVKSWKPDVVFVSNLYTYANALSSKVAPKDGGAAEWALAAAQMVEELKEYADAVVIVQSPPEGAVLADCAASGSVPADCESGADATYRIVSNADRAAARQAGATYVAVEDWYCVDGRCPAFIGTTPLKRDMIHTTKQYAAMLAPLFRARVADVLVG